MKNKKRTEYTTVLKFGLSDYVYMGTSNAIFLH